MSKRERAIELVIKFVTASTSRMYKDCLQIKLNNLDNQLYLKKIKETHEYLLCNKKIEILCPKSKTFKKT